MKTRKHKRNYKNNSKKIASGGKVIASGGFGCVFSPALKCQGNKTRGKNRITKLLTKKHALTEYNEIMTFKKKLNKISNYQNYFLINDFNICKPAKLTATDLVSFKQKCSESFKHILMFLFFFYFLTHNRFNNHLKHLGRTRLGVLIRPVWL
jgi:hypothetical protein